MEQESIPLALHFSPIAEGSERQQPENPHSEPRAGDLCPRCRQARLDYDGLLNLVCPQCGFTAGGCFT